MKHRNMHPIDQVLRILLGIVLIYVGFFNQEMVSEPLLASLLGIFGLVNLFSGVVGVCPVYAIAGINTLRKLSNSRQ